jgi:hypothetical protein
MTIKITVVQVQTKKKKKKKKSDFTLARATYWGKCTYIHEILGVT